MFSDYEKITVEVEVHREETEPEAEQASAIDVIDVDEIDVKANEHADVIDVEGNEPLKTTVKGKLKLSDITKHFRRTLK